MARMCRVLTCAKHFERWRGVRMNVHTGSAICDSAKGVGALAVGSFSGFKLFRMELCARSRNRAVEQNGTICHTHRTLYHTTTFCFYLSIR